jgi:hypothetical protein
MLQGDAMKPRRLLLPLILVAAPLLAYASLERVTDHRLYRQLDDYAKAFALKPVGSDHRNELRLWSYEPMEGGMGALIITEDGAHECAGKASSGSCKKSSVRLSGTDLESMLLALSNLRKKKAGCDDVVDGWLLTVDGVLDGERFAFEAWNPNACENPEAKNLMKILEIVGKQES